MLEQVFVDDALTPEEIAAEQLAAEVRRLESEAAAAEATAQFAEWLGAQSETTQALVSEWMALRGSRPTLSERIDKQHRKVYVVDCEHGHHESLKSHEHALFLLVDSHRVRIEDLPETRARLVALGFSPREALHRCQQIGRAVDASGRMPVADHDALVEAEIVKLESPPPAEEKR
jgi:hypothetical protein